MSNERNNTTVRITEETIPATTKHFAEVLVNGQSKGKREVNGGPSLLSFAQSVAQEFGITSFNISLDGAPVTSEAQASRPVAPASTVGVSARDSRAQLSADSNAIWFAAAMAQRLN